MRNKSRTEMNTRPILIGVGIIIVIVSLLVISGIVDISNLNLGCITCAGGFTVNSISATKVISNDADLETANFIITVTANGGGQSLSGTIQPSTIKSLTGYDVNVPITIDMSGVSEQLEYAIKNEGSLYVYGTAYSPETSTPFTGGCLTGFEYCYSMVKSSWFGFVPYLTVRSLNVKKVPSGSVGSIENPNVNWKGTITYTVAGVPYSQDVGSTTAPKDFYMGSEWVANAKWTGNLLTGQATPNQNNYKAIYDSNAWRIAPMQTYLDYRDSMTKVDTLFTSYTTTQNTLCSDWLCSAIMNPVGQHQAIVDKLKGSNERITYTASTAPSQTTTTINGIPTIVETTDRRISNPQLVFTIRAKSLGVVIPVGKVGELSATAPTFASGDANGVVVATFKNIGTGTGTFSGTFTDPSGTFTMTSNTESNKVTVLPGNTGKLTIYVGHGTTAQPTTKTGTVRIFDYNKPSNYAETQVTISMTTPKACVPESTRTSGNILYKCKPDGTGEVVVIDCTTQGGLGYTNGQYSCGQASGTQSGGVANNTNADGSIDAEKPNWYDTTPAKVLAGLIVILVALLYWRKQNE